MAIALISDLVAVVTWTWCCLDWHLAADNSGVAMVEPPAKSAIAHDYLPQNSLVRCHRKGKLRKEARLVVTVITAALILLTCLVKLSKLHNTSRNLTIQSAGLYDGR
ncbi:MAG: hypothetical protein ACYT04_24610 [Nostoc sp.]